MNKIFYLKTGETVILHETLTSTGKYVVERIVEYEDYEGRTENEPCGKQEVVDLIYRKPPTAKLNEEYEKAKEKAEAKIKELNELNSDLLTLRRELDRVKKTKTDLSNHIVNRQELMDAESITVFLGFTPHTITREANKRSLRIYQVLTVLNGKIEGWAHDINEDGMSMGAQRINDKYGLMLNATEEEILAAGKDIVASKREISGHTLQHIPEEYLTPELSQRKANYLDNRKRRDIERKEEEIKRKQEELARLMEQ